MAESSIKCPKCKTSLQPSGELVSEGRKLTVYQCDQCTHPWEIQGQVFQTALTFALDEDGNAFDPETFEPLRFEPPCEN